MTWAPRGIFSTNSATWDAYRAERELRDAIHVATEMGASRYAALYRTKLAKTPLGYVAQNHLIASLTLLAVDACVTPAGDFSRLVKNLASGSYVRTFNDGSTITYSLSGLMTRAPESLLDVGRSVVGAGLARERDGVLRRPAVLGTAPDFGGGHVPQYVT